MKLQARYPAVLGTSLVAAVFSLIVALLLVVDFMERGSYELFDTPQYLELKADLQENPNDPRIQQAIRELDRQLRASYFRHRLFMSRGVYLLIGGIVVCLITARWATALRPRLPHPDSQDEEHDPLQREQQLGRRAAVALLAATLLIMGAFVLRGDHVLPPDVDQLVSPASTDGSTVSNVAQEATKDPAQPTDTTGGESGLSPEPRPGALPTYDDYRQQWPRFRGPVGSGVSTTSEMPPQWNVETGDGVLWKVPVPLPGPNSPVLWGNRVFVSGATDEQQALFCFDADSGKQLWQLEVPVELDGAELEVADYTGHAAATVATDGLRVYAIFASGNLVAADFQGQQVWRKNLGVPNNSYGHASSLATHNDLVIVQYDQGTKRDDASKLFAFHGASGEVAWEVSRPVPASWSTPLVVRHDGRSMVITCVEPWVIAYNAEDGQELWRADCLGGEIGPSPVFADGVVYACNDICGLFAIRADGQGDVTETHLEWFTDINVPSVCTPLLMKDHILLCSAGFLSLFELGKSEDVDEPREPLWEEDLLEEVSSSPGRVGDLVYAFAEEGNAWILRPTAEACERVAELELGEPVRSSPAFSPGRLYIRGEKHLFCIGRKQASSQQPVASSMPDSQGSDALPTYDDYQQQWPRFRGPVGSGVSTTSEMPPQWNVETGDGVLWKVPVPLPGPNSPVLWGNRVFVSGATDEQQALFCFDADSGKQLWQLEVPVELDGAELEVADYTGYAAATVATDGLRVYAIFASGNLVAADFQGQQVWRKNLGVPNNSYGHASSLATHNDLVIVQYDQGTKRDDASKLFAFHGASGEVAWEVSRPVPASWSTPLVVRHDGRSMVITCVEPWVIAYNAEDGQELWRADCLGGEIGPSPVFADGVVYACNDICGLFAIRADGQGDVTETHLEWFTDINVPSVCTPLLMKDHILLCSAGFLSLFELGKSEDVDEPREPLWEEDLLEEVSSSPGRVGDLVYAFAEEGNAWILRPTAEACERVAELELGEPVWSSPAFSAGRLYIRGADNLYCIGN